MKTPKKTAGGKIIPADDLHEFANITMGLHIPRAWLRSLSLIKRETLRKFLFNFWARANDNYIRVIPRPNWCPKKYIYGDPKRPRTWP